MQFSRRIAIIILVFIAVIATGCTQGTGPAAPATPVPAGPGHLDLSLGPSDVPACFSLTGQQAKKTSDVGKRAKELGWQAGYQVTYTCPAAGAEPTVLVHSLAVYPEVNIPGIASMVYDQDRSTGLKYEDLTFPGQGSTMRGFYGKIGGVEVSGNTAGPGLLTGTGSVPEPAEVPGTDMAEIIYYKGTIFGVLKMTGPGTNTTVLKDLAFVAFKKIP